MKPDLENAQTQANAQLMNIRYLVDRLRVAREQAEDGPDETDAAEATINEDALSVEVRSGWYTPGSEDAGAKKPAEYRILLCTGGPAVQMSDALTEDGEPETAKIEFQDWFTPWTEFALPNGRDDEDALLEYARCFYSGGE
jgi:hypothetical protein